MVEVCTTAGCVCFGFPDYHMVQPAMNVVGVPNLAFGAAAVSTPYNVTVQNKYVICEGSLIPFSVGAPPGSVGGTKTGAMNNLCAFTSGSDKLIVSGQRAVIVTSTTSQNLWNCDGRVASAAQPLLIAGS